MNFSIQNGGCGYGFFLHLWVRRSFFFFFCLFMADPVAYGGSQARGPIRAIVAGLRHSHSHTASELHLRPTPQLTATPDPYPTERGQGANLRPHGC